PHGKPPNGSRDRSASCPTQATATSTGQLHGHRSATGLRYAPAAPSSARNAAWQPASSSHGTAPISVLLQLNNGRTSARPASPPSSAPTRARRRCTAAASSATPTGASHHRSYGGSASSSATPAPTAAAGAGARRAGPTGAATSRERPPKAMGRSVRAAPHATRLVIRHGLRTVPNEGRNPRPSRSLLTVPTPLGTWNTSRRLWLNH